MTDIDPAPASVRQLQPGAPVWLATAGWPVNPPRSVPAHWADTIANTAQPAAPPYAGPPPGSASSVGTPPAGAPYGTPPGSPPLTPASTPGRPAGGGPRAVRVVLAAIAAVAIALSAGVTGGYLTHRLDATTTKAAAPAAPATVLDRSSLANVAATVQPEVVSILTGSAEGSGVVLTTSGYILTNNHVVATARGSAVQVTLSNGTTLPATIVGTDPANDLAVVKASGATGLTAAKFGDSSVVQVGDTVLAIGSPLGLDGSVTAGIVSAVNRTVDGSGQRGAATISNAIQTDAAINPGNSGGALVNTNGEVIGINTAIATDGSGSGNIGVGFAIPSNTAKKVADQLIAG
jgi:putative serine protease PepD